MTLIEKYEKILAAGTETAHIRLQNQEFENANSDSYEGNTGALLSFIGSKHKDAITKGSGMKDNQRILLNPQMQLRQRCSYLL